PDYPVLFAAKIFRPSGPLIIRGETGPLGQYQIFVPRDGVLQHVSFYDPKTDRYGWIAPILNPRARFQLPRFDLFPLAPDAGDLDHDGLPDLVEDVYGTDSAKADTDGDGLSDGAEAEQGTNPLDGFVAQNGIIATARTPGRAL